MIVVVSYRSSGSNYCRGCLMESWDSELTLGEFETKEEAADFIAAEEVRQEKAAEQNEPTTREYSVIDGELLAECVTAKEALDELLKGSEA